jgi:hypothetical protein
MYQDHVSLFTNLSDFSISFLIWISSLNISLDMNRTESLGSWSDLVWLDLKLELNQKILILNKTTRTVLKISSYQIVLVQSRSSFFLLKAENIILILWACFFCFLNEPI